MEFRKIPRAKEILKSHNKVLNEISVATRIMYLIKTVIRFPIRKIKQPFELNFIKNNKLNPATI